MCANACRRRLSRGRGLSRSLAVMGVVACALTGILRAEKPAWPSTDTIWNEDSKTYDSHPCTVVSPDRSLWIAWHAYQDGQDGILLRQIKADGTLGAVERVSDQGTVQGPPSVVVTASSVWVVWSNRYDGRWRILARQKLGNAWKNAITISDESSDAIQPTALATDDGRIVVAWTARRDGRFRITCRYYGDDRWEDEQELSRSEFDAFRPAMAEDREGTVWTVWDEYDGRRYRVMGCAALPSRRPPEQISPPGQHALQATVLGTPAGLYAAWLEKEDVMGGEGIISQWHTLRAARRHAGRWHAVVDAGGSRVGAELTQGLMAMLEPNISPTGGYMGRRTDPMLLCQEDRIWLLWERKTDHQGRTPFAAGDLIGRPIDGTRWGTPLVLRQGLVDYHVVDPAVSDNGRCLVVASELPRNVRRRYHLLTVPLEAAAQWELQPWTGWKPVSLPLDKSPRARHSVHVGGKKYQLYWADLHCHTGLTSDAEGAHDELLVYARDRAQLDVVAMTNNDFIYDVPLTEYEYALANFLAREYTDSGRFVVIPGYEWTSRIPGVTSARLDDPGNWTPPYQNRSYPNHRSVLYPDEHGPIVRYPEVGNDIRELNRVVALADGVTLTQHERFQLSGDPVEVGMEVISGWGHYIGKAAAQFHNGLSSGTPIGFVACGDTHRRAPGLSGALTAIYAEQLTVDSVLDALRHRRFYATSGSPIFLDARIGDAFMGESVTTETGSVALSLRAVGTRKIVSATLIRDGKEIWKYEGDGRREIMLARTDSRLKPGPHWYYWRVAQEGSTPSLPGNLMVARGNLAWSTPHFVFVAPREAGHP